MTADQLLHAAAILVTTSQFAAPDRLQRRLRISYSRAVDVLDQLEEHGIVGPSNGSHPRDVLASAADVDELLGGAA
jgi:S-DNA-T family DNA segregation ATPase FtsK/SpoIIIE